MEEVLSSNWALMMLQSNYPKRLCISLFTFLFCFVLSSNLEGERGSVVCNFYVASSPEAELYYSVLDCCKKPSNEM